MTTDRALGETAAGPYDKSQDFDQYHMRYQTTGGGRAAQTGHRPAQENREGHRP